MFRNSAALCLGLLAFPGLALADCPSPPEPVLSLSYESRYSDDDDARATLDETRKAEAEAALAALDGYLRDLADELQAAILAPEAEQVAAADCLLERMQVWARADALAALETETVKMTIGSRLASFAIMAHAAALLAPDSVALPDVRLWLARLVNDQMTFWETAPDMASQNNLRAWAALAGAVTADLVDDPVMRGWAAWSVSYVLCQAAPDGSLPQEMRRGAYALHYQLHALAPLVTAVRYLRDQGMDLIHRCDDALERAVNFALSDLADGSTTEKITGHPQSIFENGGRVDKWQLAWLSSYIELVNDSSANEVAKELGSMFYSKLGGDQALLIGLKGRDN